MTRRVPLARRYLFGERRRAVLATAGVAVALLLVLILDGLQPGQLLFVGRTLVRHIATSLPSPCSPMTTQLCAIIRMR